MASSHEQRGQRLRIGVVSDIHGNVDGLIAALALIGDVDELICLGDIVEEYRFSNEVVRELRDRSARCVLGNHEVGLLGTQGARARGAEHVDAALLAWLADRPMSIETSVAGQRPVVTHASPCPPHTQYVIPGSPEVRRIREVDADLVLIGQMHRQMIERVGRPLVVNPGSAGQARDPRNGRRLSFAVIDASPDGFDVAIHDYALDPTSQTPALAGAGGTS